MKPTTIAENEISPEAIAEMFCEMDTSQQARFFNHIDKVASKWQIDRTYELNHITEESGLTLSGRHVMDSIGEYSHWVTVCK